jgi:hypothetical protein
MFDLFPADAFFGMTIGGGAACFHLDEMQYVRVSGDDIHFVSAMSPVAMEDGESVADQPVRGQVFAFASDFDMP